MIIVWMWFLITVLLTAIVYSFGLHFIAGVLVGYGIMFWPRVIRVMRVKVAEFKELDRIEGTKR